MTTPPDNYPEPSPVPPVCPQSRRALHVQSGQLTNRSGKLHVYEIITIIGFMVALAMAGVFLWQHFERPSDAKIRRMLPGTWSVTWGPGTHCNCTNYVGVDGKFLRRITYSHSSTVIESEGVLQVSHGILIETVTKDSRTNFLDLPTTYQGRISQADSKQIVAEFSDGFATAHYRRVTP